MGRRALDALFAVVGLLTAALLAASLARQLGWEPPAERVAAAEPMAVSTLPDGSALCTYVHVDPDTGTQLYVTSAGGICVREGAPDARGRVTTYDREEP